MINLTPAELAKVRFLTGKVYPYLHPDVRTYLNEQLLEARYYWEYQDWIERMELTRKFYEDGGLLAAGKPVKPRRKRNPAK